MPEYLTSHLDHSMTHTSTNYLKSDGDRCAQDEIMAGPQTEAWTVACVHIALVLM